MSFVASVGFAQKMVFSFVILPGSNFPANPIVPRRALPISRAGGRPIGAPKEQSPSICILALLT